MMHAVPRDPYADRYEKALDVMVPPGESDEIRLLRRRLMTSRDLASQALCTPQRHTDDALALCRVILHVASEHCYRPIAGPELSEAADLCVRLLRCTKMVDRLGGAYDAH